MDLTFDHSALRDLAGSSSAHVDAQATPDWFGIKARFLAAHALRREIALQGSAFAPGGSFTSESAGVLAARRENSTAVNPNASGNGKPLYANAANIAGHTYPAREE